ncbi:MAG: hypothetical protein RDV41_12645 [Planctomycetota bacterium]|nr:hypothetical protein [Planctomycetota bacterium]
MARKFELIDVDSSSILKAMARRDDPGSTMPKEVKDALAGAERRVRNKKFITTVSLPRVTILDNQESGFFSDSAASVYVVSLALDLTGQGAALEASSEIFERVARTASMPLIVSATPLFNNVYDNTSLPLLGKGITLYGPKDPKGLLELHVAIMEDDGGYRDLGKIVEEAAKKLDLPAIVEGAINVASLSNPAIFIARNTFKLLFHTVVTLLENNHDDIIQDFHFSSLVHQQYLQGVHPFDYRGARGFIEIDVQEK